MSNTENTANWQRTRLKPNEQQMENEELRKQKETEMDMDKINRKLAWQEIKWSALEILIDILLMIVLPALVSVATTVVMVSILSTLLG